jgi:L-alanine-DL-glutamate epimerase-like enolase superfamily enzyme
MITTTAAIIEEVEAAAYTIPADRPESNSTGEWESTSMLVVHVKAGDVQGIGYSYTSPSAAIIVRDTLAPVVYGRSAMETARCWEDLRLSIRGMGSGVAGMAAAAVDTAIWDLKARLLGLPLVSLLGAFRLKVPVYGSGGFTSYTLAELADQLAGWVESGMGMVKMKIGRERTADPLRIRTAREAVGSRTALFVDGDEAYRPKEALAVTGMLIENGVTWFEQPVHRFDFSGMKAIRDRAPAGLEIASGEYAFGAHDFLKLIEAGVADVMQADATKCGISGFLEAATLCSSNFLPLSSHSAPALHIHLGCACAPVRHVEYFHDHARIETMLFEGARQPEDGVLAPDMSRSGLGIALKKHDAERFRV